MENASKALLMAGGMLLAVLLLSVALLGYSKIRTLKTTEAKMAKNEQIKAFNAEYESYNRKLLRGIDVISVVNKAISNNERQDPVNDSDPCYINVIFITKNNAQFKTTVQKSKKNVVKSEKINSSVAEYQQAYIDKSKTPPSISDKTLGGRDSLGSCNAQGTEWKPDDNMIDFFKQKVTTITDSTISDDYIFYITPALVNFKSAIFTCTKVEYNSDGRIYQLTFEQK